MSDLKWISCAGISLNPYNLSVLDRLRDFGYALVFDEFGNGKTDKAQLCIHNVISALGEKGRNPNILIVCPEVLLQSWYSSLVSELGADFKFISDMGDTVSFFSKSISNLYIISAEQLKRAKLAKLNSNTGKSEIHAITGDSKLVWDLMIIDAGGSVFSADWEGYYENCSNKAHKLVVFAPNPFPHDEDLSSSALRKMLRRFVFDSERKNSVHELEIDEQVIIFNKNTPVMRYCLPGKTRGRGPEITTLEYEVEKEVFNSANRLAETRTGTPSYIYGGNIFEEYNPKVKSTYLLPQYDKTDVEVLKKADAKLSVFLEKLDSVLKNPENNAVVYFSCKTTLNYIHKVISTVYSDLLDRVWIQTESVLNAALLKRRFLGKKAVPARIILATDAIDEKYYGIQNVTHIFNYEYPANPAELERRFLRTGRTLQTGLFEIGNLRPEEFIVFIDKAMLFDGRILAKVMMSRLPSCFKKKIPSRNVLFWVANAEKYIAETLDDLKGVILKSEIIGEGTSFVKFSRRFCRNYNITDPQLVENSEKLRLYAERIFEELVGLLDVNNATTVFAQRLEEHIGKEGGDSLEIVKRSIETIRRGYLYYDELMNPRLIRNTNKPAEIAKRFEKNEVVVGVAGATQALEKMLEKVDTEKGEYPFVRDSVDKLPDELKNAVLYNIWKYCRFNKGYTQPLRDFMELYNKGVI